MSITSARWLRLALQAGLNGRSIGQAASATQHNVNKFLHAAHQYAVRSNLSLATNATRTMASDPIPVLTLDDLLEFNDLLLRLDRAGVPIAVDGQVSSGALDEQLSRVASHVALQIGRNRPLSEALMDISHVPPLYARALNTWRSSDRHPSALDLLVRPAVAQEVRRTDVGLTLIQPLVAIVLVYAGMLFLLWGVLPIMEAILRESRSTAGPFLRLLRFLNDSQSIWGVALPILALAIVGVWRMRSRLWRFNWLPNSQVAQRSIELSAFIDGMASRLAAGHALPASGRRNVDDGDGSWSTNSPPTPSSPLLEWALGSPQISCDGAVNPDESRVLLLRNLARAYRGRARVVATRWRKWLPIVMAVLLGGLLVLPYGLMLFGPMVELLLDICQPRKVG